MSLTASLIVAVSPVVAVTESEPAGPTQVGIGAVALTIAIAAFLGWVAYLITGSRRRRKPEETPKNLQPWLSDDELENTRLTRVLGAAAVSAAALAIVLPVYYVNETNRQARAEERFAELYVEEGEHWFQLFECSICHGTDGQGASAQHIEPRSGLSVSWSTPSLNDVFFRYSEEEVRFWIEYGRNGTPMPPAGLAGGGAMTVQEVDQVIAYLHDIQVSQTEAFEKVDGAVTQALARIENGAATVAREVFEQRAVIADIEDAPDQYAVIADYPDRIAELLGSDYTCTDESAALVGTSCGRAGFDGDRDGLTDAVESILSGELAVVVDTTILIRTVVDTDEGLAVEKVQNEGAFENLYELSLDPNNPFSMTDASGHPVADLDALDAWHRDLLAAHLNLRVTTERQQVFLDAAQGGLAALEAAAEARAWDVDFDAVAAKTGLSVEDARRAVGLFNAYCARCHTSGYSAGVAFEQEPGSGAWAPALIGGRSVVQFSNIEDQVDFVIRGSVLAEAYGTNGLGRGWMPGFGQVLSDEDIRLIVMFERSL